MMQSSLKTGLCKTRDLPENFDFFTAQPLFQVVKLCRKFYFTKVRNTGVASDSQVFVQEYI